MTILMPTAPTALDLEVDPFDGARAAKLSTTVTR